MDCSALEGTLRGLLDPVLTKLTSLEADVKWIKGYLRNGQAVEAEGANIEADDVREETANGEETEDDDEFQRPLIRHQQFNEATEGRESLHEPLGSFAADEGGVEDGEDREEELGKEDEREDEPSGADMLDHAMFEDVRGALEKEVTAMDEEQQDDDDDVVEVVQPLKPCPDNNIEVTRTGPHRYELEFDGYTLHDHTEDAEEEEMEEVESPVGPGRRGRKRKGGSDSAKKGPPACCSCCEARWRTIQTVSAANSILSITSPTSSTSYSCPICSQPLSASEVEDHLLRPPCGPPEEALNLEGRNGSGLLVPAFLMAALKPHQKDALKFLWHRLVTEKGGAVLADDLGLGKTLSTISVIVMLRRFEQASPSAPHGSFKVLVLCPAVVVQHWFNQIQQWVPQGEGLKVTVMDAGLLDDKRKRVVPQWSKFGGVLVMSYEMYRNIVLTVNPDVSQQMAGRMLTDGLSLLILDEGHKIRHEGSNITQLLKASALKCPRRLLLTGYPIQNNLMEYWTMLDLVRPGLLGDVKSFVHYVATPIVRGLFAGAHETVRRRSMALSDVLSNHLRDVVLRRELARAMAEASATGASGVLPEKRDMVIRVRLTEKQQSLYDDLIASVLEETPNDQNGGKLTAGASGLLMLVHPLFRIATHPSVAEMTKAPVQQAEDLGDDEEDIPELNEVNEADSSKLRFLMGVLRAAAETKERVLVFSQSLPTLTAVQSLLNKCNACASQGNGSATRYHYLRMDGSTPSAARTAMIDAFQDPTQPFWIFLISTNAGGEGINLTAATRVVMMDMSWNPSRDMQACLRPYRIGQKRPVFVYRLAAAGTIEDSIYRYQTLKVAMSQRILDNREVESLLSRKTIGCIVRGFPDEPLLTAPGYPQPDDQVLASGLSSLGEDLLSSITPYVPTSDVATDRGVVIDVDDTEEGELPSATATPQPTEGDRAYAESQFGQLRYSTEPVHTVRLDKRIEAAVGLQSSMNGGGGYTRSYNVVSRSVRRTGVSSAGPASQSQRGVRQGHTQQQELRQPQQTQPQAPPHDEQQQLLQEQPQQPQEEANSDAAGRSFTFERRNGVEEIEIFDDDDGVLMETDGGNVGLEAMGVEDDGADAPEYDSFGERRRRKGVLPMGDDAEPGLNLEKQWTLERDLVQRSEPGYGTLGSAHASASSTSRPHRPPAPAPAPHDPPVASRQHARSHITAPTANSTQQRRFQPRPPPQPARSPPRRASAVEHAPGGYGTLARDFRSRSRDDHGKGTYDKSGGDGRLYPIDRDRSPSPATKRAIQRQHETARRRSRSPSKRPGDQAVRNGGRGVESRAVISESRNGQQQKPQRKPQQPRQQQQQRHQQDQQQRQRPQQQQQQQQPRHHHHQHQQLHQQQQQQPQQKVHNQQQPQHKAHSPQRGIGGGGGVGGPKNNWRKDKKFPQKSRSPGRSQPHDARAKGSFRGGRGNGQIRPQQVRPGGSRYLQSLPVHPPDSFSITPPPPPSNSLWVGPSSPPPDLSGPPFSPPSAHPMNHSEWRNVDHDAAHAYGRPNKRMRGLEDGWGVHPGPGVGEGDMMRGPHPPYGDVCEGYTGW